MAGNTRLWKHEEGRLGLWCKDTHKKVELSTITSRMSLTGSFPSLHFFVKRSSSLSIFLFICLHIIKLFCWWPYVTHWILSHKYDICIDLCFRILMIDYQKVHFQSILFGKQECLSFNVEDIQFSTAKGNWPYKAARRNTRAGLLALYPVKTYCRVHTNRNRLLFEITITKTLDRAQEGVMGEGGRGRWLSAIELCTLTVQLWTKKS